MTTPDPATPAEPPTDTGHRHGRTASDASTPERAIIGRRRPVRPASPAQVQAIRGMARDHGTDLTGLLQDEYGVDRPEALSSAQASKLIDTLKAAAQV